MRQKNKKTYSITFYVYLLNYLLILSVITLKYLDIYYTLILIDDSQVTETISISQFMLTLDPVLIYLISILPLTLFFIVNFYIKKEIFYLVILSVFMVGIIIYLIPIVQNSLDILEQI